MTSAVHDDPAARAAEALRLATVSPDLAEATGLRAERDAHATGDWAAVSVARRATGVAAMQRDRLDVAVTRLRAAIAAARKASSPQLGAEAHMSLAAALVLRGSPTKAIASIEAALGELTGLGAARARIQRAAILQEIGRIDEALEDLRRALPVLRRAGDAAWETRALSNRSIMLSTRRQFAAAESDLVRAQQLCADNGLTLPEAYVQQNLGCVFAGRGDVPAALEHFDAAAARYRRMGLEEGSLLVDRATLLLSVRLVAEARENAQAAVAAFSTGQREVNLPEAQLLLSTTALLDDDLDTARTAAADAARAFSRLGRTEWLALARWAQLQADVAAAGLANNRATGSAESLPTVPVRRVRACAVQLEAAGWTVPALEARVLAGRLALTQGRPQAARADLALAARARRSGPADARARAWLAEALLRQAEGRRRGATAALRTGLKVVEDYQASLGATELRAHVSVHRGALARAGLRMALADGDARGAHFWAERGRASANLMRPLRPPADPALAHDLQDLRATMTEMDEARSDGASTVALVARQVELEQRIRDHSRRSPGSAGLPTVAPPDVTQLAHELGETAMVEFLDLDRELHAVTLVDGRMRLHALGPSDLVRRSLTHLPFALHRLAHPATSTAQLKAATDVLHHVAASLEAALLAPLAARVRDRPLLVVPAGWLQSLPWSILPSCAGRPVTVAPSAALWHAAAQRRPAARGGVVVVAGPGLPGAAAEASAVAALHPGAVVLRGVHASAAEVAGAMNGARLTHVAAHGTVRSDNPLFSSLLLADGPFTVYDLERLQRTPHHVILAACDTARSHVTAGEEILGLAAALLTQRTATLIAPVVPIPDAETAPLMTTYHRRLLAGDTPAQALADAQQQHRSGGSRSRASAASFVCLGAG